jgi:hypothetical protein
MSDKLEPYQIYDSTIRSVIVVFASLFNDITVRKYDTTGNVIADKQKVEIVFSDKQAYSMYCEQLARRPDASMPETARRFPRLSFDLMGLTPDDQRQLQPWLYKSSLASNNSYANKAYSPAAYIFDMSLSLWAKDMDTSIQVLEQILPYFKHDVSIKLKEQKQLPIANDVHIVLKGLTKNDNYIDGLTENRVIQWDMSFDVYANIWTKSKESTIIKEIVVDLKDNMS